MITLNASADYGLTGHYIAKITGRHPAHTFAREFIGRKHGKRSEQASAEIDYVGLFEVCHIDKKEGRVQGYHVVLGDDDAGYRKFRVSKEDAMKLAKLLDDRASLADLVRVDAEGQLQILSAKERAAAASAGSIEAAVEACWRALEALPTKDAKKVLAELKRRMEARGISPLAEGS